MNSLFDLLGIEPERTEWMSDAACKGASDDLWFPERGEPAHHAKAVCRECPVRQACLDYAIENGERWGIWGGMTVRERRAEKRRRKYREAAAA